MMLLKKIGCAGLQQSLQKATSPPPVIVQKPCEGATNIECLGSFMLPVMINSVYSMNAATVYYGHAANEASTASTADLGLPRINAYVGQAMETPSANNALCRYIRITVQIIKSIMPCVQCPCCCMVIRFEIEGDDHVGDADG